MEVNFVLMFLIILIWSLIRLCTIQMAF